MESAQPSIGTGPTQRGQAWPAGKSAPGSVIFNPKRPWAPLAWAIAFGVAHTLSPLFYSNQNQYLLHGLAQGGLGDLRHDWLANTRDPTPVFSALVAATYRHLPAAAFYAEYYLLLAVYLLSLVALCDRLPFRPRSGPARFAFLTLLVAVHAAILRLASVRLFGVDYPWYFQSGIANQYVLGPGLQPSAFGVLLITSIATFAHGRLVWTALLAAVACTFHATYLLPAALLTLAYMFVLYREGRGRAALALGAGTLLAVLPVVVYSVITFAPTSPEQFAEAQRLLGEFRIPHHTLPRRWFATIDALQIIWVILALELVRKTRLFPVLALPALGGLVLSLVQVATGSLSLALLFPWRISAVLVPVATAVILARLTGTLAPWLDRLSAPRRRLVWVELLALLVAVTAGGLAVHAWGLGYHMSTDELPLMDFVREHKRPGDVYLLPISVPKSAGAPRGTWSTTFTPPPRANRDRNLIAVDLQRFRLLTGAPIYVDFKSVPYKDTEVLEWRRRLDQCQRWYAAGDWGRVRDELIREGVTHVVTTADRPITDGGYEQVYADDSYQVYRLRDSRKSR